MKLAFFFILLATGSFVSAQLDDSNLVEGTIDLILWYVDLEKVSIAVRKEAEGTDKFNKVAQSQNGSAISPLFTEHGAVLKSATETLATAVTQFVEKLKRAIDDDHNLRIFHLGEVNTGLLGLENGENAVADAFNSLASGSASSGTASISDIASGFQAVATEKNELAKAFGTVEGITGVALSLSARVLLVVHHFEKLADALANLATTVSNSADAEQLTGVSDGLNAYSKVQTALAQALRDMIKK